jgi:hypothetical protein
MSPRFYGGAYYGPRVQPYEGENYGDVIASGIESYLTAKRQEKADKRAEEEYTYRKGRRETLDPLEDALLRAQLYGHGVVPQGEAPPLGDMIEADRGADLLSGRVRFGEPQVMREESRLGLRSPGSFNPATGTFNPVSIDPGFTAPRFGPQRDIDPGFTTPRLRPEYDIDPGFTAPRPGRIPLGGGYELDPSRTAEGRARAAEQEIIDALIGRGVDRGHALLDVRGGAGAREHTHPGAWQPSSLAEYRAAHAPHPERPKSPESRTEEEALGEALYQVRSQPEWKPGSLFQYLAAPTKYGRRLSAGTIQGIVAAAFKQREASELSRFRTDPYGEMGGSGGALDQQRAAWDAAAAEIRANPRKYGDKSPEEMLGPRP